jgi:hypothetical protein
MTIINAAFRLRAIIVNAMLYVPMDTLEVEFK